MAEYTLTIRVQGEDGASGPLGAAQGALSNLHGALGNILQITAGNLLAGAIQNIAGAIGDMGQKAFTAVADYDRLSRSIGSLMTDEIAQGKEVNQTVLGRVGLTKKETDELSKLNEGMARDITQRDLLAARVHEQQQVVNEMTTKWTSQGLATTTAKARLADMTQQLTDSNGEIAKNAARIETLTGKQNDMVPITKTVRVGMMDQAEAMQLVGDKADQMMARITQLGIYSPFNEQTIGTIVRTGMAYEMGSEEAFKLTQGLADFGAATGLDNQRLQLLGLALGQVKTKGKLMGQEMRQLTDSGLGVNRMARAMGMSVKDFTAAMEDGKISADKLLPALMAMLEKDFGGKAKEFSTSFAGIANSLEDVQAITLRNLSQGFFEAVRPMATQLIDAMADPAFRAKLAAMGQQVGAMASGWVNAIQNAIPRIQTKMQELAAAFSLGGVTGLASALGLPPSVVNLIGDVQMSVRKLADAITNNLAPAMDWMTNTAAPALNDALRWLDEHWTAVEGAVLGATAALGGLAVIGGVAAVIGLLVNPITLLIASAALLGAAWAEDWGGIREITASVIEFVKQSVAGWVFAFQVAGEVFNATAARMQEGQAAWLFVFQTVRDMYDSLTLKMQEGQAAWAFVFQTIGELFGQFGQWVSDGLTAAGDALANLPNVLAAAGAEAVNWFTRLGSDLVNGIKTGMIGKVNDLIATIKALLKQLHDAASGAIDAHSPSRVYAGLGLNMMQGLALGITAGAGLPAGAMAGAMGGIGGSAVSAASTGSAGAARVVYGDTFNIRISDSGAADAFLMYADARRQERLNESM